MRDPVRLIDSLDDEEGRLLLRAGRQSAPRGAKERSLAAATAIVAASAVGGGSAAAGTATATVALGTGKWLAVVGLASIGALGGTALVHEIQRPRASSTTAIGATAPSAPARATSRPAPALAVAPAQIPAVEPVVSQPVVLPADAPSPKPAPELRASRSVAPSSLAPSSLAPSSGAPSPAAATPTAGSALSFSAELQSLDEARAAVAAKEPARALAILDAYTARFPRGAMAPEAAVLRIEALTAAGDHGAAERVAEAFLRDNPGSPYAPRVHSLVGYNP